MHDEHATDNPSNLPAPPNAARGLAAFGILMLLIGLWIAKWRGAVEWPWPVLVVFSLVGLGLMRAILPMTIPQVSDEAIQQAFIRVGRGRLRCLYFLFPAHWAVKKLDVGARRLHIRELHNLAMINVGVDWLWLTETRIDTVEAYQEYAEGFVRDTLKGRMLRNEITTRWGLPAHEYEYTSRNATGWQITIPHHGTEYLLHVASRIESGYPAAKRVFEEFLSHCEFVLPPLQERSTFGGALSIGVPENFHLAKETAESVEWTAFGPPKATLTVRRHLLPPEIPLTRDILLPFVAEKPNSLGACNIGAFALKDVGISGFLSFEGSEPGPGERSWVLAIVELVTGGRFLLSFDALAPASATYAGHFQYVQICVEMIATMVEQPGSS